MKVSDVMQKNIEFVGLYDRVEDVCHLIFGRGINGVPVVEGKKLESLAYSIANYKLRINEIRHKSLERLVEEIQSFIKMMRYDDLVIKISDIDGNLVIN